MKYPVLEKILAADDPGNFLDMDETPPGPKKDEPGYLDATGKTEGPKTFEVHVAHDASIFCVVKLKAENEEDAEEQAFEMARNGQLNWELSEGNPTDDPYLPNDESIEEVD